MPPVQFSVEFIFDVPSAADWIQAGAAILSFLVTVALFIVAWQQWKASRKANDISDRQAGIMEKQSELMGLANEAARDQMRLMEFQARQGFELERGRVLRGSAWGREPGVDQVKEPGMVVFEFTVEGGTVIFHEGSVIWDLGEFGKEAESPSIGQICMSTRQYKPGETLRVEIEFPVHFPVHRSTLTGEEGTFRLGVKVFYRTLGSWREYRSAWVFSKVTGGRRRMISGAHHVGPGFERDVEITEEDFRRNVTL